ncbi:phosphatidylinositol-glycan biosynthesis class S protein [Piptocephalis cylindrospora]|uniref:Phosphatidylinositol-glycan biosynthesis class S protein n=1 Tax=Piptocephalis cylindrospora TaxID=1907219 RepID=A0A4P9Y7H3_9FUNG|nr:phosphatidylinositol-glycan biosynthesis class S protein [Piptocephalis cylindrospora]|eukprot:RKP15087.1 phosphatidylinositol-glycan biosynthesis class S protein [Piptocephalis cylindrospora]
MPDFSKTYFYPRRSRVVWAFWAVVLLGIPFWYWTTYTYRATLPHEEMEAWEEWRPRQPSFPVHSQGSGKSHDQEGTGQSVMMRWAPTYQVLFSLMVEDPRERVYGWDIGTALDEWLSPFLRRLGHTSHLEITTQVQYFTTPLIQPYYQGQSNSTSEQAHSKEYWYYEEGQLPGLIDTTNWQLASTISQAPALHLLLFLPAKAHRPLHIHTHGGGILAETDAFLIPQWGGIVLHQLEENTSPQLSSTELEPVLSIFRSQLRDLLGVQPLKAPGLEGDAQIIIKEAGEEGITGWEEDRMLRMRMVETMRKAASTLGSLSRSVQSLEHMPVQDAIRYRVEEALEWMHKACDASEEGRVAEAFQASSKAFVLSEEAFFDKDMVAMLYFPDEHKYAVYMPLFIPIAVPLLLALVQEIKWWKESRSGRGDRDTSKAKVE